MIFDTQTNSRKYKDNSDTKNTRRNRKITIISGGQTGADIAGVDAAISSNVVYSGYIPKNRLNENTGVPLRYSSFIVADTVSYKKRTKLNVELADCTIVFYSNKLTGGSKLTAEYALKCDKLLILCDISAISIEGCVQNIIYDIQNTNKNVSIVNIAGSRASKCASMYDYVYTVMCKVLSKIN